MCAISSRIAFLLEVDATIFQITQKKNKNQKRFISFNSFVAYSLKSLRAVVLGSWLELHFYWVWCVKTGFVVLYGTFARHSLGGGARAEVWGASCPGGWVGGGLSGELLYPQYTCDP